MRKSTANFHYTLERYGPLRYIALTDFGGEFTPLLEDIENVLEDVCKWEKIDLKEWGVIFQVENKWDGWNTQTNEVLALNDDNQFDAAKHLYTLIQMEAEMFNELFERAE